MPAFELDGYAHCPFSGAFLTVKGTAGMTSNTLDQERDDERTIMLIKKGTGTPAEEKEEAREEEEKKAA